MLTIERAIGLLELLACMFHACGSYFYFDHLCVHGAKAETER